MGVIYLFFIQSIATLLSFLPPALLRSLGSGVGFGVSLLKLREKVIEQNLIYAFPGELPEAIKKRKELKAAAYRHLGQLSTEIFILFSFGNRFRKWVDRYVKIRGMENFTKAQKEGKPIFFIASHMGNWEFMIAKGSLSGIPSLIVTKRIKPPWLFQALENARKKCGVEAAYEPKTTALIFSHFQKPGNAVGMVIDQYAGKPVGVRVPFFGIPVGTSNALATLVRKTGALVLPILSQREKNGRHLISVGEPMKWVTDSDSNRELVLNTAYYTEWIERQIRHRPHEWLWSHRRFKGDLSPLKPEEWLEGRTKR